MPGSSGSAGRALGGYPRIRQVNPPGFTHVGAKRRLLVRRLEALGLGVGGGSVSEASVGDLPRWGWSAFAVGMWVVEGVALVSAAHTGASSGGWRGGLGGEAVGGVVLRGAGVEGWALLVLAYEADA